MQAQRVLLNMAAAALNAAGDALPGHVIEFGLGNGRTYDHLRERLPDRRIVVFDRLVRANERSMPPPEDLVVGEIAEAAPEFARRFGATSALLHADLGNGVAAADLQLRRWLPETAYALVRNGGLVISSTPLDHPALVPEPLPSQVPTGRYFVYRRDA
jgi:hypothetical protein